MKVRIKGDISGSRNGLPWPKRGETVELPDDEAAAMCASGLAAPVAHKDDDVETAVPDDADVEKQSGGLTKATAGAVTPGGSDETKSADDGDQEPADGQEQVGSGDGDQAAADSKDQAAAPAKRTAAPAKKTAAKRTAAKPQSDTK